MPQKPSMGPLSIQRLTRDIFFLLLPTSCQKQSLFFSYKNSPSRSPEFLLFQVSTQRGAYQCTGRAYTYSSKLDRRPAPQGSKISGIHLGDIHGEFGGTSPLPKTPGSFKPGRFRGNCRSLLFMGQQSSVSHVSSSRSRSSSWRFFTPILP